MAARPSAGRRLAMQGGGFLGKGGGVEADSRGRRGLFCEKGGVLVCEGWKSWWRGREELEYCDLFIFFFFFYFGALDLLFVILDFGALNLLDVILSYWIVDGRKQ